LLAFICLDLVLAEGRTSAEQDAQLLLSLFDLRLAITVGQGHRTKVVMHSAELSSTLGHAILGGLLVMDAEDELVVGRRR
jgi:hypothetical protein